MKTFLIVTVFLFVILSLGYLLMAKKKRDAKARKPRHREKQETPPDSGKAVTPVSHEKTHDRMEVLRESISDGLKSIFSGGQFDYPKGPVPLKKADIPQDVYERVKNRFGDMKEFSSVYEISQLLDDPQVDLSKIAKKISTDPILSNRILRTANSAYFGSGRSIDSINHALALLGFVNIKSILFHNTFSKKFSKESSANPLTQALWGHSIMTALCAVYLSEAFEGLHKGKLYTLGLMHDIGKFILPKLADEAAMDPKSILPYGEKTSILQEDALLGINHAIMSRIALEDSGISEPLLQVIEFHHFPLFTHKSSYLSKEEDQKYVTALYLANQIAKLFVEEEERGLFAVQPLHHSCQSFVNRSKLDLTFSDERVLADILRSRSLIEQ